jgi:hypothetical protein
VQARRHWNTGRRSSLPYTRAEEARAEEARAEEARAEEARAEERASAAHESRALPSGSRRRRRRLSLIQVRPGRCTPGPTGSAPAASP